MNGRMIGVIGGTGRVGRECLRYLHENTAFGLLIGERKPPREALPGSFLSVDVFDEASLARFCGQCSLVINCAGPASAVRERVAAAALAGGCHYVDPGGYTPLFPILSSRRPEIRAKRLTFLLTLGILPGLSELFPVYVWPGRALIRWKALNTRAWGGIAGRSRPRGTSRGASATSATAKRPSTTNRACAGRPGCSLRAGAWIFPRPWGGIRSSG